MTADQRPSREIEYRWQIKQVRELIDDPTGTFHHGDLPYTEKRAHYDSQNLLACSLHEKAHDAPQELCRRLSEQIWNPERLEQEAAS